MLLYWPHPSALVATASIFICTTACSSPRTAGRSLRTLCAFEWISLLPLSQFNGGTNLGYGLMTSLFLSPSLSQWPH